MRMHSTIVAVLSAVACLAGHRSFAQEKASPPDVKRVVFLGDSITHAGGYIDAIETALIVQYPERHIELLNLGLPSETTSGLSEPGHAGGQFPRPDVHERLERVLEQTKPDLVIACYGMNDGIYYPLGEERFAKFKSGIERLHTAVESRGAKIIHLTPALFDAVPIKARLLPAGLDNYLQPYEGYDDVLEAYSQWLLSRKADGWQVLDVHGAIKQALLAKRKNAPNFTFAGDGVHPNAEGQVVLAEPLATAWGLKIEASGLPAHPKAKEVLALVHEKQNTLKLAWLTLTKHVRPGIATGLPLEEAQAKAAKLDSEARELVIAK